MQAGRQQSEQSVGRLWDRKDGKAGRSKPHTNRMDFYNAGFVLGMVEAQLSSHRKIPRGEGLEGEASKPFPSLGGTARKGDQEV